MAYVCEDWFPCDGSRKYQTHDGFYMDPVLKANMDVLLKNAGKKDDWDFVMLVSGGGRVRVGKCQPKGSKVLMADGIWKNVEDIKVGEKVISPNILNKKISYAKVIETDNYFSKKVYGVYKNWTGEKLYECSGNHLIPVKILRDKRKTVNGKRKHIKWEYEYKCLTAEELSKKSKRWLKNTTTKQGFYIENFKTKNADIEPYTLGYFLGDGHYMEYLKEKVNPKTNKNKIRDYRRCVGITTETKEVVDYISKVYTIIRKNKKLNNKSSTYTFSINGKLAKQLENLKLNGKGSGEKFIPIEAKKSDADYRLKLLAGLIDSDGYVDKRGIVTITSKSKKLIEDIIEICRSLGGNANIKKIKKGIKKTGFIGEYYSTQINIGKLQNKIPLINKFKKNRLKNLRDYEIHFFIKEEKPKKVYGIVLDSESKLYITDNFCVTHNSMVAQHCAIYWCYQLEKLYGYKVPFDIKKNIVFNGAQLIKQGNWLGQNRPRSPLIFDEAGADLESLKVMKGTTQAVKDFLRECGQYNLLVILVIPEYFDLPKGVALTRSDFLIDVYVSSSTEGKFIRGYFNGYSRKNKKHLYLKGKKELNYKAYGYDFHGRFPKFWVIDEKEYRKAKADALSARENIPADKEKRWMIQRDALLYFINKKKYISHQKIMDLLKEERVNLDKGTITKAIRHHMDYKQGFEPNKKEE